MKISIPKDVMQVINKLTDSGYKAYVVGGAVRDILMGKPTYDWDITTNAEPNTVLKLFENSYYTNDFGMVGIPNPIDGERPIEITTFRTEHGYSDSRRPDRVSWGKTLEEDLSRRDFTINALAIKIDDLGKEVSKTAEVNVQIIDLYGGIKDIEKKILRAVGDPNERFSEDALRMMRAVRIATETGLSIEENTLAAIKRSSDLINKISKERVRDEFMKIILSKSPDNGILLLKESGLLHHISPEIESCFGIPQVSPGRHHIYDVGTHLVMSLKHVSEKTNDGIVRLATLLHDIGKAKTYKKLSSGVITFYNHEIIGARMVKVITDRLRFSNKERDRLWKLVRFHQFTLDERQTDSAVRRFIRNVGKENIDDMLLLRVGDRLGGGAKETSWRFEEFKERIIEVQKQPFGVSDLKITGFEVMQILGITQGPKVGETLKAIYQNVVSGKLKNEKDELVKFVNKNMRG